MPPAADASHVRSTRSYEPLPPDQIRIDGYLGHWTSHNVTDELLQVPLDHYLWPYYADGLALKRWGPEDFIGKYMTAFAYSYLQEQNVVTKRFIRNRMDQIVSAWMSFQKPDGAVTVRMTRGENPHDTRWNGWFTKYVILGLVAHYQVFGEVEVLAAALKAGDWLIATFGPEERGGVEDSNRVILEPLCLLYRVTGEQRFLDFAEWLMKTRIDDEVVAELLDRSGLLERIPGPHSYTILATLLGVLDVYELTEDNQRYLEACEYAARDIIARRLQPHGGTSLREHFHEYDTTGVSNSDRLAEGCANAHLIRLCQRLFWITGDTSYVDAVEFTLYNAAIGAKNPNDTYLTSYYSPLQGHREWKRTTLDNGTPCCTASLSREIARTSDMLAAQRGPDKVAILMYNEATVSASVGSGDTTVDVTIYVRTDFPVSGAIDIAILPETEAEFTLEFRVPAWTGGFGVRLPDGTFVNGKPGTMLELRRTWFPDDRLSVSVDMSPSVFNLDHSFSSFATIRRGPQVLAADGSINHRLSSLDLPRLDANAQIDLESVPSGRLPVDWHGEQIYRTSALTEDVLLVPYAEAGQHSPEVQYRTLFRVNDGWRVVDDVALFFFGPGWRVRTDPDAYFGGTIHASSTEGDSMLFAFVGTGIEVHGPATFSPRLHSWRDPDDRPNSLTVEVDGRKVDTVSIARPQVQRLLARVDGLEPGDHVLKIACGDGSAGIDYIRYRPS